MSGSAQRAPAPPWRSERLDGPTHTIETVRCGSLRERGSDACCRRKTERPDEAPDSAWRGPVLVRCGSLREGGSDACCRLGGEVAARHVGEAPNNPARVSRGRDRHGGDHRLANRRRPRRDHGRSGMDSRLHERPERPARGRPDLGLDVSVVLGWLRSLSSARIAWPRWRRKRRSSSRRSARSPTRSSRCARH
jgi:hypothetical protein